MFQNLGKWCLTLAILQQFYELVLMMIMALFTLQLILIVDMYVYYLYMFMCIHAQVCKYMYMYICKHMESREIFQMSSTKLQLVFLK